MRCKFLDAGVELRTAFILILEQSISLSFTKALALWDANVYPMIIDIAVPGILHRPIVWLMLAKVGSSFLGLSCACLPASRA